MFNLLKHYDTQLFILINHLPHNFLLDTFFGFLTLVGYLGVVWLLFAFILFSKNRKKFKKLLAAIFTAEVIYLIFVEVLIKHLVARLRPKFSISDIILPYDFFQSYSFPSGHAAISFAAAHILGKEHKKLQWFYYLLAVLISFSRIYLGKHYPSDVVAGAIIGLVIGFLTYKSIKRFHIK